MSPPFRGKVLAARGGFAVSAVVEISGPRRFQAVPWVPGDVVAVSNPRGAAEPSDVSDVGRRARPLFLHRQSARRYSCETAGLSGVSPPLSRGRSLPPALLAHHVRLAVSGTLDRVLQLEK